MPCASCGRVQTDPVKGSSPWLRGVRAGEQILVCPDCLQEKSSLISELDKCRVCSGTRLSLVMGSVVCRECGADWVPEEDLESKRLA